jgi:hypothetical protein
MTTTKLILNSANRSSGKPHCCRFVLKNPGLKAVSYQVKKVEIPHSFYNITDRNNVINWDDDTGTNQISTLTNGNYTVDELLTHVGAVMTADTLADTGTASYTLSKDVNTKKISITNNLLANFDINWGATEVTKQLAYDLGFYPTPSAEDQGRPEPVAVNAQSTHTANNSYWIGAPKNILIKSSLANRAFKPACTTLAKGGGVVDILEQVLVDTVAGEITTKEFINPVRVPINPHNTIFELDFELLDQDLNLLDLNGREWSIQILFELEKPN